MVMHLFKWLAQGDDMLKKPQTWLLIFLTTGAAFAARALLSHQDDLFEESKDFPEILHLVDLAYVDEVDMGKLMPGAFQGVLEKVDQNASYIPPGVNPEFKGQRVFRQTGLVMGKRSGYAWVQTVAKGSPADQAGVKAGTYFRLIDGKNTRLLSLYEIRNLLANANEPIQCVLMDPEKTEEETRTITPGDFKPTGMTSHEYLDNLCLIQIPFFYEDLPKDLETYLSSISKPETRILLDFRQNAMGQDGSLHMLAGLFLQKGKLASWVNARKKKTDVLNAVDGTFSKFKLYILLSEETSGVAEMFSAVAQEQKAARIVGKPTLGRPSHYQFIPLQNGGHVELSVEHFQLNSGEMLTGVGITPDLELKDLEESDAEDPVLEAALESIRKDTLRKAS